MRIYFVFSEDLMLILTIQKVCNWFRIPPTEIAMLTKTSICSDWNHLMGNNGANWIPATGGYSSKRNILWLHTWEITFAQRKACPNFSLFLWISNANRHYVCVYCCNLSGGVALIVWFTMNGMCLKNNTIISVARASNSKRNCDVVALPILTCGRLNVTTSVRKEILRAWSLLLLASTVRSFAHMPLGISDRNTTYSSAASLPFQIWTS